MEYVSRMNVRSVRWLDFQSKTHAMNRPLNMVSVVATLRYTEWDGEGVFLEGSYRWVKIEKLYRERRRFQSRTTFEQFVAAIRGDTTRFEVYDFDVEQPWVRAK